MRYNFNYDNSRTRSNSKRDESVKPDKRTSSTYHDCDKKNQFEHISSEAEEIKIMKSSNDNSQEKQMSLCEPIEMAVDAEEFNDTAQQKEITSENVQNEVKFFFILYFFLIYIFFRMNQSLL